MLILRCFRYLRNVLRLSGAIYFSGGRSNKRARYLEVLNVALYLRNRSEWANYHSPFFDCRNYYQANPDVRDAGLEPISHYLEHGWRELRSPSQYFDASGFSAAHPHLNGQRHDLAEVCLRLYGSYAWKVDGEIVPVRNAQTSRKGFSLRERTRLFNVWQKYRRFFDANFYLLEYPDAATTTNEAFVHYMHRGFSEDRNPRRDFDGHHYRKRHGLSRGENPFRHCVDSLRDATAFPANSHDWLALRVDSVEDRNVTTDTLGLYLEENRERPSLCVHLHCFYVDLLHEVIDRIRLITIPFPLVVTVCSEVDAAAAQYLLADIMLHRELHIIVVKNRGRDIAPFLIDASAIWRKSDLVLHLHTKKSTHISWGDSWRRYLFDRTIGGEEILGWAIDYLSNHPSTGLIYPENYCMIRYFTEKEQNHCAIRSVAERLGLEYDLLTPRAYPAGSMGFYRVSALVGILDSEGLEDLFEQEMGQLDGTAAHAFERLLPEVVRQGGYEATPYATGP